MFKEMFFTILSTIYNCDYDGKEGLNIKRLIEEKDVQFVHHRFFLLHNKTVFIWF